MAPNPPPSTGGRASLWRLSQSLSPHKCRSHLGFSLDGVEGLTRADVIRLINLYLDG